MSKNEHICGSCVRKSCPEHGKETYDGMLGPTIDCMEYRSSRWFGIVWVIVAALLYCLYSWISKL